MPGDFEERQRRRRELLERLKEGNDDYVDVSGTQLPLASSPEPYLEISSSPPPPEQEPDQLTKFQLLKAALHKQLLNDAAFQTKPQDEQEALARKGSLNQKNGEQQEELVILAVAQLQNYLDTLPRPESTAEQRKEWIALFKAYNDLNCTQDKLQAEDSLTERELIRKGCEVIRWYDSKTGEISRPKDFAQNTLNKPLERYWQHQRLGYKTFEEFAVSEDEWLTLYLAPEAYNSCSDDTSRALIAHAACIRAAKEEEKDRPQREKLAALHAILRHINLTNYWSPNCFDYANFDEFASSDDPRLTAFVTLNVYADKAARVENCLMIARAACIRLERLTRAARQKHTNVWLHSGDYVLHGLVEIINAYGHKFSFKALIEDEVVHSVRMRVVEDILHYGFNIPTEIKPTVLTEAAKVFIESLKGDLASMMAILQGSDDRQRFILVEALRFCNCLTAGQEQLRDSITSDHRYDDCVDLVQQGLSQKNYSPFYYQKRALDKALTLTAFTTASVIGKRLLANAALFRLTQAKFGSKRYSPTQLKGCCELILQSEFADDLKTRKLLSWFQEGVVVHYPEWWVEQTARKGVWERITQIEFYGDQDAFFCSAHPLLLRAFDSNDDDASLAPIAILRLQRYDSMCQLGSLNDANRLYTNDHRQKLSKIVGDSYHSTD